MRTRVPEIIQDLRILREPEPMRDYMRREKERSRELARRMIEIGRGMKPVRSARTIRALLPEPPAETEREK